MSINLSSSALLELRGSDVVAFAHAQFSSDVQSLGDGRWQWSAWLSPQGRVRNFFALLRAAGNHLIMIQRGGDAAETRDALRRFVLRSDVSIVSTEAAIIGVDDASELSRWLPSRPTGDGIVVDGDCMAIAVSPARSIVIAPHSPSARVLPDVDAQRRWRLADIRDGLPEIDKPLDQSALPQWLGLDRLGVVSVSKGCYPGQEIMSRLHFKGGNKRSLYRIAVTDSVNLSAGDSVVAADASSIAGEVVMAERDGALQEALCILSHTAAELPLVLASMPHVAVEVLQRFE